MNTLLAGLPGSGKSHHAVRLIVDALKDARVVVTNVAVIPERVASLKLPGLLVVLDEDAMKGGEFFFEYPGAVFVLDEVRKWLPSGLQQKDLAKGFDKMLSEHRHFEDWRGRSSEVILISQCASQLPRCVRTLIDTTVIFEKLHKVGLKRFYRSQTYSGPQSLVDRRKADLLSSARAPPHRPRDRRPARAPHRRIQRPEPNANPKQTPR